MSSKKYLRPEEIVKFDIDYYKILNINKDDLKDAKTLEEKKKNAEILEKAYRIAARKAHPDCGGTAQQFKLVVQAHTVLSDPILKSYYDSKGTKKIYMAEDQVIDPNTINWEKLGTYRKGSIADTIGYSLFFLISNKKQELNIVPAFRPSDELYDNYEWDWAIPDKNAKLALSIVADEDDVLRLTTGDENIEFLPFKIYICIPRMCVQFLRNNENKIIESKDKKQKVEFKSNIIGAIYSDIDLLETTQLKEAENYINNQLYLDLQKYREGVLEKEQEEKDRKLNIARWMNTENIKQHDINVLKQILKSKSYTFKYNENAADFLNNLPDEE